MMMAVAGIRRNDGAGLSLKEDPAIESRSSPGRIVDCRPTGRPGCDSASPSRTRQTVIKARSRPCPRIFQAFFATDAAYQLAAVAPRGPPAYPVRLKDTHLIAALGQVQRRGNAGKPGADDTDVATACSPELRVVGGYIRSCRVIGITVWLRVMIRHNSAG